jgi:DNA (cytosine-5)-methyltransferase 1
MDLFAGCGGLSLGLMEAGWTGLFAIEKSPMAFETLKYNLMGRNDKYSYSWPEWLPEEPLDIREVLRTYSDKLLEFNDVDLLVGGPPCQGFSMAGKRKVDDERNNLINDYLSFVKLIRPKLILVENVRTFATPFSKTERGEKGKLVVEDQFNADELLQQSIVALKYRPFVQYPIWAKDFGVPQLRQRYILIGIREDLLEGLTDPNVDPFVLLSKNRLSFLRSKKLPIKPITLSQGISDLQRKNGIATCLEPGMKRFKQGKYGPLTGPYQKLMRKKRDGTAFLEKTIVDSHRFAKHKITTKQRFEKIISTFTHGKQLTKEQTLSLGLQKHRVAPLSSKEPCHTLTSLPDDLIHYSEPRILTVREYARIQSFPDWFEFKSGYTSGGERRKTQVPRYTQVANAVPPLLANALGNALLKVLEIISERRTDQ